MKPITAVAFTMMTAGIAGLLRSEYEKRCFTIEDTEICSDKIKKEKYVIFLTDLHDKEFGAENSRLISAIKRRCPDLILIGGDTMIAKPGKVQLEATNHLLRGLADICPVYYANGNHEQRLRKETQEYGDSYRKFRMLLEQYGVTYLSDTSVDVAEDLRISGMDIDRQYYKNFSPETMRVPYINRHLGSAAKERYQILLAHSPLFFDAYAQWGADLTLAGHFHGGTIRLPLIGGVMTPQFQFFVPWCAGTFEQNGRYLIVGRGIGTHSINIRFCNKPQVVGIRLLPKV